MEKTLEQDFCPPLCLLLEAFLLAWEDEHKLIQFPPWCSRLDHKSQIRSIHNIKEYTLTQMQYSDRIPKASVFFFNDHCLKAPKD